MSDDSGPILCHTTRWYSRRRLIMIALLLAFSAYFFYDWKVGYPKKRAEYEVYWPEFRKLQEDDREGEWFDLAKEKGWPAKPKEENWDRKIGEQLFFGVLTGAGGLAMLAFFLRNRHRTLSADDESFTTPDGRRIPFAAARRIDKRKWDNKGLAYVYYDDNGTQRKAVIDDLIFGGAVRVLDRLLGKFHGELVELEKPPADDDAAAPQDDPADGANPPAAQP